MSFSKSNVSHASSFSLAKSMIYSDFGLSCFDYPLDRQNRNTVCALLAALNCKIVAVWVCGRPVKGNNSPNTFEHWVVKIQAPPSLISIDFLECKKKGAFALQQCPSNNAHLKDFLHYFYRDKNGRKRRKWEILASATPSPLKNKSYLHHLDTHDIETLKLYNAKKSINDHSRYLSSIECNRKVCDIGEFVRMWTSELPSLKARANAYVLHQKSMKSSKRQRPYNAITSNCQQFAVDLFDFLVGHRYPTKVKMLKKRVQSPFDIKLYAEDSVNQAYENEASELSPNQQYIFQRKKKFFSAKPKEKSGNKKSAMV